jgi:AcrR family transcriptional regulator
MEANVQQQLGLRERKKQRTRESIAATARRLFIERGFEAVTVGEVAREADVSRKTVFNYFPTKEDLFFSGLERFEERLLDAIREREPGESILHAFGRFVTDLPREGLLAAEDPKAIEHLREFNRLITESPALSARERQVYARYTDALAALIADQTRARPGDVAPQVAANAMIGLHQALVEYVRRRVLAGETDRKRIARGLRSQARQALALLERGLGELGAPSASRKRSA